MDGGDRAKAYLARGLGDFLQGVQVRLRDLQANERARMWTRCFGQVGRLVATNWLIHRFIDSLIINRLEVKTYLADVRPVAHRDQVDGLDA